MVFGMIASLLSILSSSLVYLAGAIIFSKQESALVAYVVSLVVITIVLFLARLLFFKGERHMRHTMRNMRPTGFMKWRMMRSYKHTHERKVISGGVARILAFGLIFYLTTYSMFAVYVAAAFAVFCSLFFLLSFKHKFIDIITGAILGLAVGFFSLKFAPLIMGLIGL